MAVQTGNDIMIGDIMEMTKAQLTYALTRFILKVRKKTGENYPSQTLYEIVISLQLYLCMYGRDFKFLDDKDFVAVRNTLDNRMKELSRAGIVAPRIQAQAITIEQENKLWSEGVLGDSNPKQLSDTILYMFGLHFALRAGVEHHNLHVGPNSQITVKFDNQLKKEYLEYTEDCSKNQQGGIDQRKIQCKVVRAYENSENHARCIVRLYQKYISLHPKGDKCPDAMYLHALAVPKEDCWYTMQPIGRHKLVGMVASLLSQIGVTGKITNHSLHATAASRLYQRKLDEQLIMETTGHRSTSVRSYKRMSSDQMKDVS